MSGRGKRGRPGLKGKRGKKGMPGALDPVRQAQFDALPDIVKRVTVVDRGTVNTTQTLDASHLGTYVFVTPSSAVTVNLPAATNGSFLVLRNQHASNVLTLQTSSGGATGITVNGNTSASLMFFGGSGAWVRM